MDFNEDPVKSSLDPHLHLINMWSQPNSTDTADQKTNKKKKYTQTGYNPLAEVGLGVVVAESHPLLVCQALTDYLRCFFKRFFVQKYAFI